MMKTADQLKNEVRERYARIAEQEKAVNAASCCGATDTSNKVYNIMMDDYTGLDGYVEEADLGLGCGLPLEYAHIKEGDTVIDLGSGAGNDCFVARHATGASGKVIGIDFTPAMINKARANADKMGFNNVEFREGDIDNMPVNDDSADVIVSNCVLNLVPDKKRVIQEIYRVLKPTGHFSISDIVLVGELPEALKKDAEMYAGCVAGAIQKDAYLDLIKETGFKNIKLQKEKTITLPDDILGKYLNAEEIEAFNNGGTGIYSITVFATKSNVEKDMKLPIQESGCCSGSSCC